VGFTVSAARATVEFFVNGQTERVPFTGPIPHPLLGTTGYVGYKRFEGSQLTGFVGDVRALWIDPSADAGQAEHNAWHNQFAEALGRERLTPAAASGAAAVFLDPANEDAFAEGFLLPQEPVADIGAAMVEGQRVLRIGGDTSAGVDLDENDRARGDMVEFSFPFRIERGDHHVLCTVGDANEPVRVVARAQQVLVVADGEEFECGTLRAGEWNEIALSTAGERTTVALNGGEAAGATHTPVATWLYLGQGYRTGEVSAENAFGIDVSSVRSRVVRQGE
jgi:hypothetical protein